MNEIFANVFNAQTNSTPDSSSNDSDNSSKNSVSSEPDNSSSIQTFTVVFDSQGGSLVATQKLALEERITEPQAPIRAGYTFDGWYLQDAAWSFSSPIDEDMTLTAKWTLAVYSVTYHTDETQLLSQAPTSFTINDLPISLHLPAIDKKEFVFGGWYLDDGYTLPATQITEVGDAHIYPQLLTPTEGVVYSVHPYQQDYATVDDYTGTDPDVVIAKEYNGVPVTFITPYPFSYREDITSLTLPNTITGIAWASFQGCSGLEKITVEEGNPVYHSENNCLIETESKRLYLGCKNSVIPTDGSVTFIEMYAFYGCTGLTSITIPEGVTTIQHAAFSLCENLESITLPESLTELISAAFANCTSLSHITIPKNVTKLNSNIFYNCCNLKSITLPENLKTITNGPFILCSSLESITIPKATTEIVGNNFLECDNLKSITVEEGNPVYHSDGNCLIETESKTLITGCQNSVTPEGVTSIGSGAFSFCNGLTSITIPNSVTSIEDYAFRDCSSLTSITIPDGVTSIGDYAFSECIGLTSITIPNSVTSIGGWAFNGCSGLTSIVVESGNTVYHSEGNCLIETASNTLILGCQNSVIPDSVTSIGEYAFRYCSGLTSIVIPDSVTSIGDYAFSNCSGLTSITMGDGVTSIGDSAFYYCSGLTSITIPDGVTSIGSGAFQNCSGLTSIVVPDGVTSIGFGAFSWCSGLTSVYYMGTSEEWATISISTSSWWGGGNTCLTNAARYYYSETEPIEKGNYWHYVDGEVVVW